MSEWRILPENVALVPKEGASILDAALAAGVPLTHACGGEAKCSTCRVAVISGLESCPPRGPAEQAMADKLGFEPHLRLACQTPARPGLVVRRLVLDHDDETLATRSLLEGKPTAVGEEIEAAILLSDIRGFTGIARRLTAYDTVHGLNRYFQKAGESITAHGGRIDNYMGDGYLAVFPKNPGEAHPCVRAVRAAHEIVHGVETQDRPYFLRGYGIDFRIGIGIHYGKVVAGEIGHTASRRTTIIGEAVNLAARIEAATKRAGTPLLVSEAVRALADAAFTWGPAHEYELPGTEGTHRLFAPAD